LNATATILPLSTYLSAEEESLVALIVYIIVDITIKQANEESNKIPAVQQ
jgi:hypothetical protein